MDFFFYRLASAKDADPLEKLPYAEHATFNHFSRGAESLCLPNTRVQVLQEIMAWASGETGRGADDSGSSNGSGGGERVYWLNGMAGTGKSAIARTVARKCFDAGRLAGSFFFSRGGGELESARKLVTTIARQLSTLSPALRRNICAAVTAYSGNVADQLLSDQWKQLVLRPLTQLLAAAVTADDAGKAPVWPLVVVIDALDECRDENEITFVLQLLSETSELGMGRRLLIFLTSRPEIPIRCGIANIPAAQRRHLILHRIDPSVVGRDLYTFFKHSFSMIRRERVLPSDWPGDGSLHQLVSKAGGLFIWAATACRFVRDGRCFADRRLADLLHPGASTMASGSERALDNIYMLVLRDAIGKGYSDDEAAALCLTLRTVLGTIAVLSASLAAPSIAALLDLPANNVPHILSDLHSIVDITDDVAEPVRLHHASFRDFLLDSARCTDTRFWVNEEQMHASLAEHCLCVLFDNLQQDICDLRDATLIIDGIDDAVLAVHLPSHLCYACLYWVDHIRRSGSKAQFLKQVDSFSQKHLLHWLEVVSLLRKLADAVDMLFQLEDLCVSICK
jgi:hypothetical protein